MRSEWGLGRRLRRACWLGVACVLCSGGAKAETAGVAAHWVSGHAYATVRAAEILQFCSARLAWQLLQEAPAQLALCPLSIAISQPEGESRILLSWRVPPGHSPGQQGVQALFSHLLSRIRAELP